MARGVVRHTGDGLVPGIFVERTRLKAEGGQEGAPATPGPGLVFRRLEELLAVALSAERFRDPEQGEVRPSTPDVPLRAAKDSIALVPQEDRARAVVGVPGGRRVEEREAVADRVDLIRTRPVSGDYPDVLYADLLRRGYASTTSTSSNSSTTRTVSSESGLPSSSISPAQASRWSCLKASASSPKPSPRTTPGAGRPKVVS